LSQEIAKMVKNLLLTGSSDGSRNRVSFGGRIGGAKQSSSNDSTVNSALKNDVKDVIISDSQKFEITREVRNSVINIYNPKNVVLGGMGENDPTTRSERREQELEARRRRQTSPLQQTNPELRKLGIGAGVEKDSDGGGLFGMGIATSERILGALLLKGSGLLTFINPLSKGFGDAKVLRGPLAGTIGKTLRIPIQMLRGLIGVTRAGAGGLARGADAASSAIGRAGARGFPTVSGMVDKVMGTTRAGSGTLSVSRRPPAVTRAATAAKTAASMGGRAALGAGRLLVGGLAIPLELGLYGITDTIRRSADVQATLQSIQEDMKGGLLGNQTGARLQILQQMQSEGKGPRKYHMDMSQFFMGTVLPLFEDSKKKYIQEMREYEEAKQIAMASARAGGVGIPMPTPPTRPTQKDFLSVYGPGAFFMNPEVGQRTFKPSTILAAANMHKDRIKELDNGVNYGTVNGVDLSGMSPLDMSRRSLESLRESASQMSQAPGAFRANMSGLDQISSTSMTTSDDVVRMFNVVGNALSTISKQVGKQSQPILDVPNNTRPLRRSIPIPGRSGSGPAE